MDPSDRLRTALADRYAVDREIGRGGMALVYLAQDLRHHRDVAIKVLKPEFSIAVSAERFLQEIRIEAQLKHPYILPLFDSGEAGGLLYYVMPYVQGQSLQARLRLDTQLPLEEALSITREIAEALAYAHARGVVHRDVKPGNILLDESHAMLADFGIARAISELGASALSDSGMVVGTPEYMSPEQCSSKGKIDGRSDIYALGCVLYEMLSGEPPFTGPTAQAIIARHLQDRPRSLRVVRSSIPEHIEEAIQVALAKVPADRYTTAIRFVDALKPEGETVSAVRRSRVSRSRQKRKTVVTLAGAAMLLSLGFWKASVPSVPVLDRNKVVLFPLTERGAGSNSGAGYDVAVMLSAALDHAQPLKWIDGAQRLGPKATESPPSAGELRSIARGQGAAYYIDGAVLGGGPESSVVLRLHDTKGDSVVAQEIASASRGQASPVQLGLQAATRLLPALVDPGRTIDLTPLSDRKAGATALWIQGEREYRRSRFRTALDFYQRAVKEDSGMVFAAVKGAQAAGWLSEGGEDKAHGLISVALSRQALLPSKQQSFARGWQHFLTGSADSAVVWLRNAIKEAPEWAEAHMALGEVFFHRLPSEPLPLDSLAQAEFAEASRYDSGFAPPLYHLAEDAVRRGNQEDAVALIERFKQFDPDSSRSHQLILMLSCIKGGPTAVDWQSEVAANPLDVLQAAKSLSAAAAHNNCAERGFRALFAKADLEDLHWGAFLGLHGIVMSEMRYREIPALIDSALARGLMRAPALYFVDVLAGAPLDSAAKARATAWRQEYGDRYQDISLETRWLLAAWCAHVRDTTRLARLSAGLLADSQATSLPLKQELAGQFALARADTAGAVRSFRALRVNAPGAMIDWGLVEPLPAERLILAEFAYSQGDFAEAYRVASMFDHPAPIAYLAFLPVALSIRLRAAKAMGRPDLVRRDEARLRRLKHGGGMAVAFEPGGKGG